MTNTETSIYPVPNINEIPAYEDNNIKIWAELPSKILLNVKSDNTFIGMDYDGWRELVEKVTNFEIPKKAKKGKEHTNPFDLDSNINIWVGKFLIPEKNGKTAIQLYYISGAAYFTKDEWRHFKTSVLEATLVITDLYNLYLKEDEVLCEKHRLGLLEGAGLAQFSICANPWRSVLILNYRIDYI